MEKTASSEAATGKSMPPAGAGATTCETGATEILSAAGSRDRRENPVFQCHVPSKAANGHLTPRDSAGHIGKKTGSTETRSRAPRNGNAGHAPSTAATNRMMPTVSARHITCGTTDTETRSEPHQSILSPGPARLTAAVILITLAGGAPRTGNGTGSTATPWAAGQCASLPENAPSTDVPDRLSPKAGARRTTSVPVITMAIRRQASRSGHLTTACLPQQQNRARSTAADGMPVHAAGASTTTSADRITAILRHPCCGALAAPAGEDSTTRAMSCSNSARRPSWSMSWSWSNSSAVRFASTKMCTTRTASGTTTARKTSSCGAGASRPGNVSRTRPPGP